MKAIFLLLSTILFASCNINQQAKEIKALADCHYRIYSVDELSIAGTNVKKLLEQKRFDLTALPSLALGFLNQNVPLRSTLTFEINNPTDITASIQEFDYELLINKHAFTKGTYDQPIIVPAGDTLQVPIQLQSNIYSFLADDSTRNQIQQFLQATQQGVEKKTTITIRIKPGILVGDQVIKIPGFITVDKEISNRTLL